MSGDAALNPALPNPALSNPAPQNPALQRLQDDLADLEDLVGHDPARAAVQARALAVRARLLADAAALVQAQVWEAEAVQRDGDAAAAVALLTAVREDHPTLPRELSVRASWVLARVFTDLGDRPTALEHALDAAAAFSEAATASDVPVRVRTRVLIKVADLLDELGAHEDSRSWYGRAEELAVGDAQLHLLVVNNRAYCELERGDREAAQRELELLLSLSDRYARPLNANALDTVARIQLLCGAGRLAEAAAQAAVATVDQTDARNSDDLPVHLLTLAVAQRTLGEPGAASETLVRARAACGPEGFAQVRTQILAEQAEVFAALGDFAAAFATHKEFHAADKRLLSQQREAQARARQAMFETDVARQEAARYREEARRDPLTGLRNRLFVDERLPALVEEFHLGGRIVSAVLLDLDHFKSVNDTYSHDGGDEVLRIIAGMLEDAVAGRPDCFAARLGGEEFLLVLVTDDEDCAVTAAEQVRATVQGYDWSAVTPGRGITVSGGTCAILPTGDKTTLLAEADARLYRAKALGRNRIVTT